MRKPRFAHWLSGFQAEAVALCALRKSRLISHRDNVNPFGASFLNYVTAIKLTEVTIDATTFVEMEGSFETDLPVRVWPGRFDGVSNRHIACSGKASQTGKCTFL